MTSTTTHQDNFPANSHQAEPIVLTAVAHLVNNGDGGLEASWLLEGGTAELFAGMTLLVAENADLCAENGSAEVVMAQEYDQLRTDRSKCWEEFKALRRSADARETELQARLEKRDALLTKMKALFRVDDPFDLYGQVCEALSDGVEDEMPYQGIPGTSFQRLNMLANEGE